MANNYAVQRIHLTWLCVERYGVSDLSTFQEALCHISMEKNMTGLDTLLQELTKMCVLRMNINSSGRQIRPWRLFNRKQKIASKLLLAQRAVFYHKMGLVWFKKKNKNNTHFLKRIKSKFCPEITFQINNTELPRDSCHQTESICTQTHFDSGNIKQNLWNHWLKTARLTALMKHLSCLWVWAPWYV